MPTDQCPLAEFAPGERFNRLVVAVRSVRAATDKNGRHFADVKVGDWSGSRSAKFWKVSEPEINALCKASFLEISGDVDASERFAGDFTVSSYAVVSEPDDITPFLEKPRANHGEYRKRLAKLVNGVQDAELRAVLKSIFIDDPDYRQRFFRAYAAGGVHHAFAGGLLEHTVEVAELCSRACEVLNGLDHDLLVTGALLHDIGKMEEMNQELRAGDYTDDGCLIGHLVLGSVTVAVAIDKHNGSCDEGCEISAESKRALMHLILSHHGLPDHGAAKRPAFAEAAVLYLCDNISAKARQHLDLVSGNAVGATSAHNNFLETRVYLKPPRTPAKKGETAALPDLLLFEETPLEAAMSLPILGLVAAGTPDEMSEPAVTDWRKAVPPPEGADYLLHVVGDSMIEAGITEGDLLFVKRQDASRDGDIVVAHIAGEGQTVKRLRLNANPPYLEAANAKYPPRPLNAETRIQGKVTGLLRDF